MTTEQTLKVQKIEDGTVIDHISAGKGWEVVKLLGLETYPETVTLLSNVYSKTFGKKDIVKIEGKIVDEDAANILALISPGATVNIIKGSKVEKKFVVELPDVLKNVGKCPNPNCMTNSED